MKVYMEASGEEASCERQEHNNMKPTWIVEALKHYYKYDTEVEAYLSYRHDPQFFNTDSSPLVLQSQS